MDWCFDPDEGDLGALRREVRDYLARHAAEDSDVDAAELVFAEIAANAVEHAPGLVWVSIDWAGPAPRLTVHDLGELFDLDPALPQDPAAVAGRGVFIASRLTDDLAVAAKRSGGKRVTVTLPVRRSSERDISPPRRRHTSLPLAVEADTDGYFDRESFLRALVVQVAETVDDQYGPEAVERTIAQVGTDVGGRMEDEYRSARNLDGSLTPAQLAEFYVGLKAHIGGDFYVIEATADRIVLGNRRCPFGDAVKQAPGLCRMTSSVFGSAAAHTGHRSTVVLEERIAVGDPECRVVVWLTAPPPDVASVAHTYDPTTTTPPDGPGAAPA